MTHNLNRILIDNGYQPEWILMQKEIKGTIDQLRESIVVSRKKLGNPMTTTEQKQWNQVCEQFHEDIRKLNKRVNDFNLIVPLLTRQKVHFDAQKEIARAQETYETFIKSKEVTEKNPNNIDQGEGEKTPGVKTGFFNWTNMWKFIKA